MSVDMASNHQQLDDYVQFNGNGNGGHDFASNGDSSSSVDVDVDVDEIVPMAAIPDPNNYEELFPSLGGGGVNMTMSDAWNKDSGRSKPRTAHTTQVFHVPQEERNRAQLGNNNTNDIKRRCEDIATKCGVKVEMCCSKDQSLHIVVSGLEEGVNRAKKEIQQDVTAKREHKIQVPKEHHRFLIGNKGTSLKNLQERTATNIQIPRSELNSDTITITGPKDGIEQAVHEIQMICDEQSKSGFERLNIPKNMHPWIRGCDNEVAKDIMARTGVKINIPPPHIEKDEIAISGDKERVEQAVAEIMQIYNRLKRLNITKLAIQITKSQHKLIIGKNGNTVQEIFRDYDVYVQVPRDEKDETIYLYGEESKLGPALSQVCAKANSVMSASVEAPTWLHRYMIGEKGTNISKITADYPNTHVNFENDNRITLDGPPEEVERVKERLTNITHGLKQNMVCEEIPVDVKYHAQLAGRYYKDVARMNKEYGVLVRIPDAPVDDSCVLTTEPTKPTNNKSNRPPFNNTNNNGPKKPVANKLPNNIVRIEGAPESVARAKAELLATIKRLEDERSKDIIIEQKYHSTLIGKQGRNLEEIRDMFNGIQINIPRAEEKSDVVQIRGNKLEVEKCFKHLTQKVKEMAESNYQEEVHIFKQFHKLIIGKHGAFIRRVKDETQTRIEVPAEDSHSDCVLIVGKKENVARARTMLEDKVKELLKIEEDSVEIDQALHKALIGKGGLVIKHVRQECGGVLINFPAENSPNQNRITLKGPREDIDKAKAELLQLAKSKADVSYSDEVHAKLEYHRFLVGKRGSAVNSLKDKYQVRVIFPSYNNPDSNNNAAGTSEHPASDIITLVGKEENVRKAKEELEATIKQLEEQVTEQVQVDPKWHKQFTARRGYLINKISDEHCNVKISFPKLVPGAGGADAPQVASSDLVTLKGPRAAVEAAKKKVLETVHDFENQVTIEVDIPQRFHVNIIGKKGVNSQQICDDHRVEIKFPARSDRDQQQQQPKRNVQQTNGDGDADEEADAAPTSEGPKITISGLKEDCERARDAMLALLPVTEDVPFPHVFHRELLANKAEILQKITNDYGVQVNVPKREQSAEHISLVGTRESIDQARESLTKSLADFESKNFRAEITDFHADFIPTVRGREGKEAQRLETQYNIRIDISRRDDPPKIVIKGEEANVKKCEEYLLGKIKKEQAKVSKEIEIDNRVHSRIIGSRGTALAKIADKFKVEIKFANRNNASDIVVVRGDSEASVDEACDHLKNLEEEYIQDVTEKFEHVHPSKMAENERSSKGGPSNGFVVQGAPWESNGGGNVKRNEPAPDTANMDLFPTMSTAMSGGTNGQKPSWGPRR